MVKNQEQKRIYLACPYSNPNPRTHVMQAFQNSVTKYEVSIKSWQSKKTFNLDEVLTITTS